MVLEHPTFIGSNPQAGIVPQADTGGWRIAPSMALPYTARFPDDKTEPIYIEADLRALSIFAPVVETDSGDSDPGSTGGTDDGGSDDGDDGTGGGGDGGDPGDSDDGTDDGPDDTDPQDDSEGGSGGGIEMLTSSEVYVDFAYTGGNESGEPESPFNTLYEALEVVVDGGTILIAGGVSHETAASISKPVTLARWNIGPPGPIVFGDITACGPDIDSFAYTDFSVAPSLRPVRDADVVGSEIRLVPFDSAGLRAGGVWTRQRVVVERGFDVTFKFNLLFQPGSDGITFIVQNAGEDPDLPHGGNMGYHGMSNSLAVEFDAHQNEEIMGDPSNNHVSVHPGGNAHESASIAYAETPFLRGATQTARIVYDARDETLEVYLQPPLSLPIQLLTLPNFKITDYVGLIDGAAYIGIVATSGDPLAGNGPTILTEWSASFPQSCEKVFWQAPYFPFTLDGYDGDKFDHMITGTFLQPGDLIKEHLTLLSDGVGYLPGDLAGIIGGANSYWIIEQDTRVHNGTSISGLWRGRFDPAMADGEFDNHRLDPLSASLQNFAQNGGKLGTVEFLQTMTYSRGTPASPIDTDIVVARHRISFRFVRVEPQFTANYPTCTFTGAWLFHQVVKKQDAFENLPNVPDIYLEAIKPQPLIPCP